MTPGATSAMLARYGERVILRRPTGRGFRIDVHCMARIDTSLPTRATPEIVGVTQPYQRAILGNAEIEAAGWPGPPRRGDQLIGCGGPGFGTRTHTIGVVSTSDIGGVIERHDVEMQGAVA